MSTTSAPTLFKSDFVPSISDIEIIGGTYRKTIVYNSGDFTYRSNYDNSYVNNLVIDDNKYDSFKTCVTIDSNIDSFITYVTELDNKCEDVIEPSTPKMGVVFKNLNMFRNDALRNMLKRVVKVYDSDNDVILSQQFVDSLRQLDAKYFKLLEQKLMEEDGVISIGNHNVTMAILLVIIRCLFIVIRSNGLNAVVWDDVSSKPIDNDTPPHEEFLLRMIMYIVLDNKTISPNNITNKLVTEQGQYSNAGTIIAYLRTVFDCGTLDHDSTGFAHQLILGCQQPLINYNTRLSLHTALNICNDSGFMLDSSKFETMDDMLELVKNADVERQDKISDYYLHDVMRGTIRYHYLKTYQQVFTTYKREIDFAALSYAMLAPAALSANVVEGVAIIELMPKLEAKLRKNFTPDHRFNNNLSNNLFYRLTCIDPALTAADINHLCEQLTGFGITEVNMTHR